MSNNHIDPELATEVFVFEPLPARTYKLLHGRIFREGKTAWTKLHRAWLARLLCFDAAVEIECKFLSSGAPAGVERSPATRIEQGYIAIASDGTEVRVRRA